jgi:hypothetical protein
MALRVETTSGSVYYLDTESKMVKRTPGEDAGALAGDDTTHQYIETAEPPTIGKSLFVLWNNKGKLQVRGTTPVVSIEEI